MIWGEVLAKLGRGEALSPMEIEELRRAGGVLQVLSGLVGRIDPQTERFRFNLAEFDGDITAYGGDLNSNTPSATEDARVNLQTQQITRGAVWYDQSEQNVVLQNLVSTKSIILNTNAGPVLVFSATGDLAALGLDGCATDPAYIDGYAILYFFSSGGADELRVRGKIGAVEQQVTLANLSP